MADDHADIEETGDAWKRTSVLGFGTILVSTRTNEKNTCDLADSDLKDGIGKCENLLKQVHDHVTSNNLATWVLEVSQLEDPYQNHLK
jgi:hypothetical protein